MFWSICVHLFPKYVWDMMLVRVRVLATMTLLVGETETAFLVVATGDVGCWSESLSLPTPLFLSID